MNVLVLGAYGLIGDVIVAQLLRDGHSVTGLGRNVSAARLRRPSARWVEADIGKLLAAADWAPLLSGVDAIVNAAGALQDGARDNLDALHRAAIVALVAACEQAGVKRFIQISAAGVASEAATDFLRTKAAGDSAVAQSSLDWTIFRPGLVIAPAAYGGTALLRAIAGFPFFAPVVLSKSRIQTVSVDDVADAVSRALGQGLASRQTIDLVEDQPHELGDIVLALRRWLGVSPALLLRLPPWLASATGKFADALSWLGWRSPLRSTAIRTLADGVFGNPEPWIKITGQPLRSLDKILATMASSVQERWFARMWVMKPFAIICLSLFWLASGLIGFWQFERAASVLTARGFSTDAATFFVLAGSVADIAVGVGILVRRFAKLALFGMLAITLSYLAAATLFAPDLWADPLGPLVKTLPALCLVLVALGLLEER